MLPEVHGIDKGVDLILRPEKQVVMPMSTQVRSQTPTESEG